jgi:phosphonate transport system substrate-binding protein
MQKHKMAKKGGGDKYSINSSNIKVNQMSRRNFVKLLTILPITTSAINTNAKSPIRIGLTPVILDDQLGFLHDWRVWLESRLNTPIQFVQRQKYRDISDALLSNELDAAWVCGYPYIRFRPKMQLLAVPRYKDKLTYHSCIITNKSNDRIKKVTQLKDSIFAYSDPDSNSGFLYPQYRFKGLGLNPSTFFQRTFFSWSHRNTIDAVANGLADAGAVDSYILEQYNIHHPEVTENIKIIEKSPAFGFPPLVVRNNLELQLKQQLSDVFIHMQQDIEGYKLLQRLGLDSFDRGSNDLFSSIEEMALELNDRSKSILQHASSS